MRVFLTGATGYIGSAIARELSVAGHEVVGLTRLAENASYLEPLGVTPVIGDLRDPASWSGAAEESDALVHAAVEESDAGRAVDRMAIATLAEVATAADRPRSLVYTSDCFVLGETGSQPADERASTSAAAAYSGWRVAHEREVLALRDGVTAAVVRPGMVYGGRDGVFADFFASAERDGAAAFIGDGANRWSPVYRGDVARLYRLVVERQARGVFHAAEPAARVGELAMAASRAAGAGGATRRIRVESARKRMGLLAEALTLDQVIACGRSRELGWSPRHPAFRESADSVYREWRS